MYTVSTTKGLYERNLKRINKIKNFIGKDIVYKRGQEVKRAHVTGTAHAAGVIVDNDDTFVRLEDIIQ